MQKSKILTRSALTVILFAVGFVFAGCGKDDASTTATSGTAQTSGGAAIKDPDGYYKYFSDASITKPPQKDAPFGNGQTISLEYDGSKSKEGDSLFYQLSYVNKDGSVLPVTGGAFTGVTRGTFSTNGKVFTSDADGRPGFIEVSIVQNARVVGGEAGVAGKNVKLGVYPIVFEVSK